VAVPAETALDPPAAHGLVAGHDVLHVSGEEVAVVRQAVGERRTVVEHELVKKAPAKRAPSTAPAAKKVVKSPFGEKFLEQQRTVLIEERARYTHQADSLKAEADALMLDRDPGDVQFDEESGEGDTVAVERERDLALSAQARAAVEEIDAAIARIDDGTYGICVTSGQPIPKERLEAIPWAAERVEVKVGGFGRR
jgi:RNA polymerase-binding transcription factor DksA